MHAASSFRILLPVLGTLTVVLGILGIWLMVRLSRGYGPWRLLGLTVLGLIAMSVGGAAVLENVPRENTAVVSVRVLDSGVELLVDGAPSTLEARGPMLVDELLQLPPAQALPEGRREHTRRIEASDRRWRVALETASLAGDEGWLLGVDSEDRGRRHHRELLLRVERDRVPVPFRVYLDYRDQRFLNRVQHEFLVLVDPQAN